MTKQEEIKEGIGFILTDEFCAKIVASPDIMTVCEGDCVPCRTKHIFSYLCDNDVVMKVERELGFARVDGTGSELWYDGYKAAMEDHKEAGYVVVEPLIKGGEDDG